VICGAGRSLALPGSPILQATESWPQKGIAKLSDVRSNESQHDETHLKSRGASGAFEDTVVPSRMTGVGDSRADRLGTSFLPIFLLRIGKR
jgi:hypothetical protein